MNVIHVAGTKGKGSTCAFAESFLRAHGRRTGFPKRTGLYTGPHLLYPEERIRINFKPIAQELFAKYFFEVYNTLNRADAPERKPRSLQLYALVCFHTFIKEGGKSFQVGSSYWIFPFCFSVSFNSELTQQLSS
jgi:folylpolyglutamate synthase